jgi:hypothetical protein
MSTQSPEATTRAFEADVDALIDARGPGFAIWLLWLIPAVAFLVALART